MNPLGPVSPRVSVTPRLETMLSQASGLPREVFLQEDRGSFSQLKQKIQLVRGSGGAWSDVSLDKDSITLRGLALENVCRSVRQAALQGALAGLGHPLGGGFLGTLYGAIGLAEKAGADPEFSPILQQLTSYGQKSVTIRSEDLKRVPVTLTLLPAQPELTSTALQMRQIDRLTLEASGYQIEASSQLQTYLNERAQPLDKQWVEAMQDHRFLGIGERHAGVIPERHLLSSLLPELRAAGATHLALELPSGFQGLLDDFEKSGKLDGSKLPGMLQNCPSFLKVLTSARQAGLKLMAVDLDDKGPFVSGVSLYTTSRDQHMAGCISSILNQNPGNKVVYLVGANHLNDNLPGTTASRLREAGHSLFTVLSDDVEWGQSIANLTDNAATPLALRREDSESLNELIRKAKPGTDESFNTHDLTVWFPRATLDSLRASQ